MAGDSLYVVNPDQVINDAWFNRLLGDVNLRLRAIEAIKAQLEGAISDLTAVGLSRIDQTIVPVIEQTTASLTALVQSAQGDVTALIQGAQEDVEAIQQQVAASAQQIEDLLAGGVPAANVTEDDDRVFLTPAQRDAMATFATSLNAALTGLTALNGAVKLGGAVTPAALAADAGDYAPAGLATAARVRVSGSAARLIHGLAAGVDGQVLVVENVGAFDITLKAQSTTATAANRFALVSDVVLAKQGGAATLVYDAPLARWTLAGGGQASDLAVGVVVDGAQSPGSKWLPCNGLNYLNASYPTLAPLMPAYLNALVSTGSFSGKNVYDGLYANGQHVIFGYDGAYCYWTSPDLQTWTRYASPLSGAPDAMAAGNGLVVVVRGTTVYKTIDLQNWTAAPSPSSMGGVSQLLYYINGFMAAGTTSGGPSVSTAPADLAAWTYRGQTTGSGAPIGIAYSPVSGRVVVGLASGSSYIASPDNGATWTAYSDNGVKPFKIFWTGTKFVFVAATFIGTTTSAAALAVLSKPSIFTGNMVAAWFDGVNLIVIDDAGNIGRSADEAASWEKIGNLGLSVPKLIIRANSAATTPMFFAGSTSGAKYGLGASTTQFTTPVIAGRASNLNAYIKAL